MANLELQSSLDSVYFTADTHFSHENILKYCARPFANVEEMDDAMIINWNVVVRNSDRVYHLGDVTLQGLDVFTAYMRRLKGEIFVVPGSHDWRWMKELKKHKMHLLSASGIPITILEPLVTLEFKWKGQHNLPVVLCHYAMRVWDRSHHGSLHLYGHSHGTLPGLDKSMDVGVDANGFTPISLGAVVEKLM